MKNKLKGFVSVCRQNYLLGTVASSTFSAMINAVYTVFNGVLGIVYHSLWNGSICVYYFLLALIRAIIVCSESKRHNKNCDKRKKVYFYTHILLIIMNISLVVPIVVMVKGGKSYTYGLVPAIALAAYTTYRITISSVHFQKSKRSNNLLISELRTINLIDSLLALLTLQNALIAANGGMSESMYVLSSWTSAGILLEIVIITVRSFLKIRR